MISERLSKLSYKVIKVRPIFVLLNLAHIDEKHVKALSPRRRHASENSNKNRSVIQSILISSLGYFYALSSYLYIKYYLGRGNIVICDRFFYQFLFDLFGSWSEHIIRFFPTPDVVFLLDCDFSICHNRINSVFDLSVSEDYYVSAINFYRKNIKNNDFVIIDGNLSKDEICNYICSYLIEFIQVEGV